MADPSPTDFFKPSGARPPRHRRPWHLEFPAELPISARRLEIVEAIRRHQILIIAGETGSGKTTQLPKFCLAAGRERIACTQPRRVAAISLSQRVAQELNVTWGREVGCKIRFMDKSGPDTAVKFLTDGMLLAEAQGDPLLRAYDTIIVDEAHERSLNIDFLLGHLNLLRHRRRDLQILITSATIDTAAFSRSFGNAPVIQVSGRMYPVQVVYSPVDEMLEEAGEFTHLDAVAVAVERILLESDRGDILVFLATERDIRETADLLQTRGLGPLDILPLFGRLSAPQQQRVFSPSPNRKIVLSTNIAETSLTIPGIRFVVDTGEARLSRFNSRTRTRRLPIEPISRSSADQRKGRCGRVAEGVCIRLYSEEDFQKRIEFTPPEIQRANLADVILRMKAANLGDIEQFPFIDPPPHAAVRAGYALLEELGAITAPSTPPRSASNAPREVATPPPDTRQPIVDALSGRRPAEIQAGNPCVLTPLGRDLARLPVDPIVGRMLVEAIRERCVREVLVIAAALSIQDPRERPDDAVAAADAAHKRFVHPESDFLTILAIWDAFHNEVETLSQGRLRKFCRQHFLNYSRMREWRDIHDQLDEALADATGSGSTGNESTPSAGSDDLRFGGGRYCAIHRALLPGLLANVARREEGNLFRAGGDRRVVVFPGSALFDRKARERSRERTAGARAPKHSKNPDWIVAAEIVETARLYARTCARIDVEWLLELGAHISSVAHSDPVFTVESGRVLTRETTRLHGLEIRVRSVGYGAIDAKRATEIFIREGLLNDELRTPHRFLEHNRRLRDKVEVLRTRMRGGQYLDLDETMYRFYAARLENVSSLHDLNRAVRSRIAAEPEFLCMRESDLLGDLPEDFDHAAYPDEVVLENTALPLHYAYRPGQDADGVTLRVTPEQVRTISPGMLDWLVPGHLAEKVDHLLRGLPKDIRRQLIPIGEAAASIAREIRPTHATFVESLAAHLEKHRSIRTFPSDWKPELLPNHLRVRIEIVGTDDRSIAAGRELAQVQERLTEQQREAARRPSQGVEEAWRKAAARCELTGLETWTIDELPERVDIADVAGLPVHAYPGFRVETAGVALRLFKTPEESRIDLQPALQRFFAHELRYELAWLDRDLKDVAKLGPLALTLAPIEKLAQHVREHIRRHLCAREVNPLTRAAFEAAASKAREESKGLLWRVLDQMKTVLTLRQDLLVQPPGYPESTRDLNRLVPADFPRTMTEGQMKQLPRYLRAMRTRDRKAKENPARDKERAHSISRLEQRVAALEKARRLTPETQAELTWMIEELRVSIFAQELGTAFPISEKRIEKRLAEFAG